MIPHYIIDGYNLIHRIPQLRTALDSGLEQARSMLISFVRAYQTGKKLKITIVFDGEEVGYIDRSNQNRPGLRIIFSSPPEKADPLIKRLIQTADNKKSLILVSDDSELVCFCKQSGADALSPEDFYHRASKHPHLTHLDQKYNSDVSQDDLDQWLKLFTEDRT